MSRTIIASRYVEVEIDLDDIDTNDLEEELRSRCGGVSIETGGRVDVSDIYLQLKFGNSDRALELTRMFIEDQLGVIL